ncbi:MAG TPA: DUF488 domain-containing protein [Thermodesulfobacteriota bacterium]|nr:DUF488 domain-containing protein [Thermodesulfobacteriota bacterium]
MEKTLVENKRIFTIGHGTRSLDQFIGLLLSFQVQLVVDIRTVPRSRHNPQFNRETLPDDLGKENIGYHHQSGLGGLRKTVPDSVNRGWHNASFRGFADYMQIEAFESNLNALIKSVHEQTLVLMCAETLPWRCHRSLIADALVIRNIPVFHIFKMGTAEEHKLTSFARVRGTALTYPASESNREI